MASSKKTKGTPKKGAGKEPARQTKKQIAIGRKQARQNRIIWISVGSLAIVVVAILAIGVISEVLVKPNQPVATVNGVKIPTDDYQNLLRYQRYNLHASIADAQEVISNLDPEDEQSEILGTIYQQQLEQLQTSLALAPQTALDELIEDELIQQKAEELGISASEAEVEETIFNDIQQAMAQSPQVPITGTEEIPTPTPLPQSQVNEIYDSIVNNIGLSDQAFRDIIQRSLLRTKVQEALASQVPTTGLVAHVQLIQTDTRDKATEAQARIEAGEAFTVVAQEVSSDTLTVSAGGDLGWVTTGELPARYGQEVEDTAFSAEIGTVVLVESNDQYYLVLVVERDENGPIPEGVLSARQNAALDNWLTERVEAPDVQIERLLEDSQIPDDPFLQTFVP
jgi:hypothetical protein